MSSERARVRSIRKALDALPGVLVLKYHGGPFGVRGHPDLYGACRGQAFALEVKRPGEMLAPAQEAQLRRWKRAGAITGRVETADDALRLLVGEE